MYHYGIIAVFGTHDKCITYKCIGMISSTSEKRNSKQPPQPPPPFSILGSNVFGDIAWQACSAVLFIPT